MIHEYAKNRQLSYVHSYASLLNIFTTIARRGNIDPDEVLHIIFLKFLQIKMQILFSRRIDDEELHVARLNQAWLCDKRCHLIAGILRGALVHSR